MSEGSKENPVFIGKSPEQLRGIAGNCIVLATETKDPLERLAFLQYSAEALSRAKLTIENLGLEMSDIIRVANRAYQGSAPMATAIHQLATDIISSYPRER